MVIRLVNLVLVILVAGFSLLIFVPGGTSPEQVVKKYIQMAATGGTENTSEIICEVPQVYYDKWLERIDKSSSPSDSILPNEELSNPRASESLKFSYTLTNGFLQEFKERSLIFDRVSDVWTSGSEARIRVIFRSTINERILVRKDFLLYKEKKDWRIFRITSPSDSERWAQD